MYSAWVLEEMYLIPIGHEWNFPNSRKSMGGSNDFNAPECGRWTFCESDRQRKVLSGYANPVTDGYGRGLLVNIRSEGHAPLTVQALVERRQTDPSGRKGK